MVENRPILTFLAHVVLAQLKGEGDAPASAKLEAK